jgi:hypothetical protein
MCRSLRVREYRHVVKDCLEKKGEYDVYMIRLTAPGVISSNCQAILQPRTPHMRHRPSWYITEMLGTSVVP